MMQMDPAVQKRMIRNGALSLFIYALPVLLMFLTLYLSGHRPWENMPGATGNGSGIARAVPHPTHGYGFMLFIVVLGVVEFSFGLYGHEWNKNEKALDLACFAIPKLVFAPFFAWFSLTVLPLLFPRQHNVFGWVSFFWGVLILCIADDLTQYWYHRMHHEIPWLWRFHRTHHSAPYMGMSMAGRQNAIYSIFFSQTYLTSILVYLGFGPAAATVLGVKSTITTLAHSSIPWDKPLYRYKALGPIAWVVERVISTPATHHAHHASSTDDGIGFYKGNFGNMFFLWDVIFGTAHISRQYPKEYGISHYEGDPWYSQLLWPILKSNIPGSELAANGPVVKTDIDIQIPVQEFAGDNLPIQA
jgi:sterol desaturase/sphingolipid hydroxylase (fatty acid hydroxylase superfamily)